MSLVPITITINGTPTPAQVEPRMLLVQFLRDELELTGTHVGCDTSQCGACTVSLNGEAVKSCTLFAVQADGMDVQTIEGIGSMDDLHPIQAAFWEMHGLQCGFCTPGMIMASAEIIRRNPDPTEDEIREQLGGNFCRCTGYHNIVRAISSAAATMREKGAEAGQAADD